MQPIQKQPRQLRHQKAFLAAFELTGCVRRAAGAAGIAARNHYRWLQHDAGYAAAFREAQRIAGDLLEAEAVQRATTGWLEPVYYQGRKCGNVRRYDGSLLQFLLRGFLPEKYGNRPKIAPVPGVAESKMEVVFVEPASAGAGHPALHNAATGSSALAIPALGSGVMPHQRQTVTNATERSTSTGTRELPPTATGDGRDHAQTLRDGG